MTTYMAMTVQSTTTYKSIFNQDVQGKMKDTEKNKLFTELVAQYSEKLYWTIRRIVLNHDDANDVMQNVFVKAWNNLDQFEERSKPSTWLYRIAINESLDFLRRKRDFVAYDSDLTDGVGSRLVADEYFDGDATQAALQEAIETLPDVQRVVFNLRYYEEMKYSEMSSLLNTSEGSLKASYHIAVKKIYNHLLSKNT